jgi:hypothetical protein
MRGLKLRSIVAWHGVRMQKGMKQGLVVLSLFVNITCEVAKTLR